MMHYNMDLAELENMIPWELESYLGLLNNHLREVKQKKERR